jgi:diphthine-ammonia ligase
MQTNYIVSWSGGKDCLFAMHKTIEKWGKPLALLSSIPKNNNQTLAHGYRDAILNQQAKAMGLPIRFMFFDDGNYRPTYIETLTELKFELELTHVVFGDIYLNEHRDWLVDVCTEVGLEPVFPLWCTPADADDLYEQYINLGYKSLIVHARNPLPGKEWLGKTLDKAFGDVAKGKFCPMGENGEFHTLAIDGPCFTYGLRPIVGDVVSTEKGHTLPIIDLEPVLNQT